MSMEKELELIEAAISQLQEIQIRLLTRLSSTTGIEGKGDSTWGGTVPTLTNQPQPTKDTL